MKWTSAPSSYRNCTCLTSVCTRANFSPARKVSSTTAPDSRFFSFVRTNAPPLPGFTCWNSTIRHIEPRCSMCMPFRNWLVETISAMPTADSTSDDRQLLPETGQSLGAVVRHKNEILDPHAADARAGRRQAPR